MGAIDFSNPVKWGLLILILLDYLWSLLVFRLSDRQLKKPLPESVRDIYDAEAYSRWLAYRRDCRRLSFIRNTVLTGLTLVLFAFDLFAWVYYTLRLDAVPGGWGVVYLMMLFALFSWVVGIPFDYADTFLVEEKHGFNKSTRKTFWLDELKQGILNLLLNTGLLGASVGLYKLIGLWLVLGLFIILAVIMVVSSLFTLPLQRLFNRFTPLPGGPLRDRLNRLFDANGYGIRSIYVMDASRRTTKTNAFCTGLGRQKKIALYDNLVNKYTEDEITAVFAHELGHAKHRDTLTLTLLQLVVYAILSLCIGCMVATDAISVAMGFAAGSVNMAAVLIALFSVVSEPLMTVIRIPINLVSRRMERAADRFATENGLGEALISSLKRLSKDNLSNLNPHPFLSLLEDSHPTITQRIDWIRAAEGRVGSQ